MAAIKTDPSQKKAVVVLLIVLGGAVVFTISRIHPDTPRQATTAPTTAAVTQASSSCVTVVPAFQSARNPFRKPDAIRAAFGKSRGGIGAIGMSGDGARPSESFGVGVMPVGGLPSATRTTAPEATPSGRTDTTAKTEPAKPQFALLATVGGPGGMCAVIRGGESNPRVVAVGDIVEGGYRVQRIEKSRAVLRNGGDTVVVTRPS
jgi:hypothetical protein